MKKLFRLILITFFLAFTFGFVEPSALASSTASPSHEATIQSESSKTQDVHVSIASHLTEVHTEEHDGPHIPPPKGSAIEGWYLAGIPITNTVFSTWIFMVLLFALVGVMHVAIKTERFPKLRAFGLDIVNRIFLYAENLIGNTKIAKKYMWLLGGLIVAIFLGNLTGLVFDWFVLISHDEWLGAYLRPIYSDLNTTLVFSLTVILVAQLTAFYLKGPAQHLAHYLWNYHGDSPAEKVVSVFIGWLHLFGEFIRIGSLSMRLFLNIFVGAILIGVVIFVGEKIPSFHTGAFRILVLPFWFFELLVAFLQAYIFMTLSSLYLKEALPEKHH